MGKRTLLMALAALALAVGLVTCWLLGSAHTSNSLAVSLIARTNDTVVVGVKNAGSQPLEVLDHFLVEYRSAWPQENYSGEVHPLTNTGITLASGAAFQVCFAAPTNQLSWRVCIGGFGQRQVTLKRTLNSLWPLKNHPLVLKPEYGQTEWFAP